MEPRILFTKELPKAYIQQKLGDGFELFFLPVIGFRSSSEIMDTRDCHHFVFTSIQGVRSVEGKINFPENTKCYTVGEKAREALKGLGLSVEITAKNAQELSSKMKNCMRPTKIMHFCGSKALPTLKQELTAAGFEWIENVVYETILLYPEWHKPTEALVFFSPSGVESFLKKNKINHQRLFAIGETTAKFLRNLSSNKVITSKKETLEDLLQVIKDNYND
ncbi:uroporphyrinogen-III synthase [Elizabethkingia argentiflava]|uniref:Uroporphyrinogen-III synthase n=1 Tax=Elizabethkingia argenteiflava TaxID=2681556 RepID=A0A845PSM0_9FLAO|nr:uroporphyrinogen-III synthase [Elizabethkingia argenteiflava]NAW50655.1 uroporphyrinogen-III synthase [Elizabethkingia argenteiflava]